MIGVEWINENWILMFSYVQLCSVVMNYSELIYVAMKQPSLSEIKVK